MSITSWSSCCWWLYTYMPHSTLKSLWNTTSYPSSTTCNNFPLKYICFLVWSRHLEKLKNRINMSRNYLRYFKTCLMALILSFSKTLSRLLMLCVCVVEWFKPCEDSSHCSLWEKSSGNFQQSDSSTKTKNLAPIFCSEIEIKPYHMIKNCFRYFWTCLPIFLFSGGDWELQGLSVF